MGILLSYHLFFISYDIFIYHEERKAIPFQPWQAGRSEILSLLLTSSNLPPFQLLTDLLTQTPKRNAGTKHTHTHKTQKNFKCVLLNCYALLEKLGEPGLLKASCCENTSSSCIVAFQSMSPTILIPLSDWIGKGQPSGWYCLSMASEGLGKWWGWGMAFSVPVGFL